MSNAQSKQLAAPWQTLGVPPYLRCGKWRIGWCSEGGIGTGDNGKNISSSSPVLSDGWRALRCGLHIRTAAATASQRRNRGVQGRGRGSLSAAQGFMTASLFAGKTAQTGRQQAPVKLRAARGANSARCQRASAILVGNVSSVGAGCEAEGVQDRGSLLPWMGGQCMCGLPTPRCLWAYWITWLQWHVLGITQT